MDTFTATMIAEGNYDIAGEEEPVSYDTVIEAWQHLIDTGVVWQLQGWFGRQAERLIDGGICHRKEI